MSFSNRILPKGLVPKRCGHLINIYNCNYRTGNSWHHIELLHLLTTCRSFDFYTRKQIISIDPKEVPLGYQDEIMTLLIYLYENGIIPNQRGKKQTINTTKILLGFFSHYQCRTARKKRNPFYECVMEHKA